MEPAYARLIMVTMMTLTFESAVHIRFSRRLFPSDAVDHMSNMLLSLMITNEMAQYLPGIRRIPFLFRSSACYASVCIPADAGVLCHTSIPSFHIPQ